MVLDATDWSLEFSSGIPVYKQIIHLVQVAIASGSLREGDRLPTIRALHQQLQVNPNTIVRAYRELEMMGAINVEHGSGCFIAPASPKPEHSEEEKQAKIKSIAARFKAEAQSQGLLFSDVLNYLNTSDHP